MERADAKLRAAVIMAGKQIVQLNFGRKTIRLLRILRRVLRESRKILGERAKAVVRILGPSQGSQYRLAGFNTR